MFVVKQVTIEELEVKRRRDVEAEILKNDAARNKMQVHVGASRACRVYRRGA